MNEQNVRRHLRPQGKPQVFQLTRPFSAVKLETVQVTQYVYEINSVCLTCRVLSGGFRLARSGHPVERLFRLFGTEPRRCDWQFSAAFLFAVTGEFAADPFWSRSSR
jgi:hypothetical protein